MHPYDLYRKLYGGRLPTERDPRYLELVRMSKYTIHDFPISQPGKCANCGAARSDGRKYLDIGLELEFYGIVVFCSICVADFARTLGLYRANELRILQLEQKIENLLQHKELGEEIKNTVLHTYEQVKEYFDANSGAGFSSSKHITDGSSSVESLDKAVTETDRSAISTKSGSSKSSTVSRSSNVPKLTELLNTTNK